VRHPYCHAQIEPYRRLGYRVVLTSALTGLGVDELREILHAKMTVLAGLSGVGKSSLLAAVEPGLDLRTRAVSKHLHGGKHTTSQVNLYELGPGGYVADTPGIREFGLSSLARSELVSHYPEITSRAAECRFADCTHTHEPGCAVKRAVRKGAVSATRYQSYRQILGSLSK